MHLPNHRRPFQAQTPSMYTDVLGETHRFQHLWPEHAAVPDLNPFVEHWVEGEDFEGRL
jgi:hypothetical protein